MWNTMLHWNCEFLYKVIYVCKRITSVYIITNLLCVSKSSQTDAVCDYLHRLPCQISHANCIAHQTEALSWGQLQKVFFTHHQYTCFLEFQQFLHKFMAPIWVENMIHKHIFVWNGCRRWGHIQYFHMVTLYVFCVLVLARIPEHST